MTIAQVLRRRILAGAIRERVCGAKGPKEKTINGVRGKKGRDRTVKEDRGKGHSLEAVVLKAAFIVVFLAVLVFFVINNYFPGAADRLFGPM
ncbi:MAG: hypothetical protein SWE60_21565 [Thermodesulfobacteriota bacterium]|nr:hypothetical protein [Thermodesulfobacteriota bacterium]